MRRRLGIPAGERLPTVLAALAGIGTVFGFAPFDLPFLPAVTLAVLFALWQHRGPGAAARLGFAFGAGLFGAGVSWVYIALHTFGNMPAPLAAIGTAGFCGFLALYPALAGWLATRWTLPGSGARLAASAAGWTVCEWLRSWIFTGFPWLGVGYAQLPESGPAALAGFAPVGGVWLVGLAMALIAACLAGTIDALVQERRRSLAAAALTVAALLGGGATLQRIDWTHATGTPLAVSLVQGNVAQDVKFESGYREATFRLYIALVRASRGRLVVLPESAFPAFADEIPQPVIEALADVAVARHGDVLTGLFTAEPPLPGSEMPRYYNSVMSVGSSGTQVYRKRHLVPFGETIPLEPVIGWFIRHVLSIPLANQSAGAPDQRALPVAGQRVAIDICYEDAFGPDIRAQAAGATLLVNVTNDAWYGHSLAALQHNQIAAMRAAETGRPLLRATNTGITSAIDHTGRIIDRLPWFTRGTLEVTVTGREGITPYVRWGDTPVVIIALLLLVAAVAWSHRGREARGDSGPRALRRGSASISR